MKYQVKVTKQNVVTNMAEGFNSMEEAQQWASHHESEGNFGKRLSVIETSPAAFDEDGNELHGAYYETIPAEYTIEIGPAEISQELINDESLKYLESTDWFVVRFMETGITIPDEVVDKRKEARSKVVR